MTRSLPMCVYGCAAKSTQSSTGLGEVQRALVGQASRHAATVMPGFTHLQVAQPVTFGHHMLAYVEMFERDRERMLDARQRVNRLPLGAAALAGTTFPIDRAFVAERLGFEAVAANSLDACQRSRFRDRISRRVRRC